MEVVIMYAHDIVIVVDDSMTLLRALDIWDDVLRREGLSMNKEKTEVRKIERERAGRS